MAKKSDEIPLLQKNSSQSYGSTVNDQSPSAEQTESKPLTSFKRLFSCATRPEIVYLIIGVLFGAGSGFWPPMSIFINMHPINLAFYIEQYRRNLSVNESIDDYMFGVIDEIKYQANIALLLSTGTSIAQFTMNCIHMYIFGLVAVRMSKRLRHKYVSHVLGVDMSWSQGKSAGELTALLDDNISKISDAIENNLPQAIYLAFSNFFYLAYGLFIRWDVTLIMMCFFLPATSLYYVGTKRCVKLIGIEQGLLTRAAEIATECFMCIKTVICFNGQPRTIQKYNFKVAEAMRVSHKRTLWTAFTDASKVVLFDSLIIAGLWYGGLELKNTEPGMLLAIVIYGLRISSTIPMLNVHINAVFVAMGSADQIHSILSIKPKIEVDEGDTMLEFSPEICFDKVTFSYPSRPDVEVIKDFSFTFKAGEKVAVVGETGCGKSTVAALLMRFFDPDSGKITLDGQDLKTLNVKWLREQFGFVPQEPILFDMSIKENVRSNKDVSPELIDRSLYLANAWNFVMELPEALETPAGERGTQLSGGQKQRVAIARALVKNPSIFIFDEATSSLDSESDALVQDAIQKISKGRTTITIGHRLSTTMSADKIIVIDKGMILEHGTPQELIDKKANFHKMLQQQTIIGNRKPKPKKGYVSSDTSLTASDDYRRQKNLDTARKKSVRKMSVASMQMMGEHDFNINRDMEDDGHYKYNNNKNGSEPERKSTWQALKQLMGLHPRGKLLPPLIIITSILRATKCVLYVALVALEVDALSYSEDMLKYRLNLFEFCSVGLVLVGFVIEVCLYIFVPRYSDQLTSEIRSSVLTHFLSQNFAYFDTTDSGYLSGSLFTHAANIREAVSSKVPELFTAALAQTMGVIVMFCVNYMLALVCFGLTAFMSIIRLLEMRALVKEERQLQILQREAITLASEAFTNLDTVKAYCLESFFVERYRLRYVDIEKQNLRRVFINCILTSFGNTVTFFNITVIYWFAAYLMTWDQELSMFEILIVQWLTLTVVDRLFMILTQSRMIARFVASCGAVVATLDEPIPVNALSQAGISKTIRGDVDLRKVDFSYPSRPDIKVFNQLSLHIERNKTIAIVGPSGSGKSTIIQLILRLYDCDAGQVAIDGINIATHKLSHLHNTVVPVSQEPTLFNGTIWENISYGLEPSEVTEQKVFQAASNANIHEFIRLLPLGYNTEVGQLGAQLSRGQKQRIAIARALIRDPKLLLLDEATASLDTASEELVQASLDSAQHKCTCVVVAHRLSTIQNADLIFVVAEGRIVEKGTHAQLMDEQGLYHNMCMRQAIPEDS